MSGPFRLPFDRYQRYAVAARAVDIWRAGSSGLRVLEVGANVHRDLEQFLDDRVVYMDVASQGRDGDAERFVQGDGMACPFADRAFDVVVALDVLEHVPADRRPTFLAELMRLAKRGVVIAAPFASDAVSACEGAANDYYRDLHGADYPWLAEHQARGLPDLTETMDQIRALGWQATAWGAGSLALWGKLMQAHFYVNSEPDLLELRGDVDEIYNRALAERDGAAPVYRHFIACAPAAVRLQEVAEALRPQGRLHGSELGRLQERLDRLYTAGERRRSRRARAVREHERGEQQRLVGEHAAALAAQQADISALEAQARERDAALAELSAQVAQQQAAIDELAARGRDKDAALAELGRQLAARQSRATNALAALRGSLARLGAAFGTLLALARAGTRLWRSRVHAMRLEPLHDLVQDADGYRSLGDDPQLLLHSERRRLPRSWVVISFAVELRGQWLSPKLYADAGNGFSEEHSFALPVRAGRRVECLIGLPDRVRALRLDPLTAPGRFVLRDVSIREVGLVQLATALLPHVRSAAGEPRELLRLAMVGLAALRAGGGRALTESLLARDREVSDYQDWIDAYDTLSDSERVLIRRHIDTLPKTPLISVLMPTYETPEAYLRRAIESVRHQLYPNWELCIADDGSSAPHVRRVIEEYLERDPRIKVVYREKRGHISAASNSALELATGTYVALLDHDDELAERALYLMAVEIDRYPAADVLYSDEDKLSVTGQRFHPYFKPDWNPDLFLAQNLVTHLCVCRTSRVLEVGGFRTGYEGAQDWDLVTRIAERTAAANIRHVPHILYHWRAAPGSTALAIGEKNYASAAQYRTLTTHFERLGQRVEILPIAGLCWRIRYPLPQPAPLVTIIIPTRDCGALLRRCIASLRQRTAYPRLQFVIIDNQSSERATLSYLAELAAQPDVTVVRHDAPFNYSAINNLGARHARGEVLALINNDVEAISAGWLEEMVSQACRPEIGAVGGMLYYPNDTIQHAGVILGLGTSGIGAHAYAFRPRGYVGQIGRAVLTQGMSAVTAACMVVRRAVFEEVGGFDEENLTIAYNDLDLCLRIRGRGYRNLWTPYAEFYHLESASRGHEDTPAKRERFQQEIDYMRRRWGRALQSDPAYNPNLSLDGESFTLAFPPRTAKPWLEVAERDDAAAVADRRA